MTVTVYHGEDVDGSYAAVTERVLVAKKNGLTVFKLDGKELDRERFFSLTAQEDFFAQGKLIVINDLLRRPKSKVRDQLIELLQDCEEEIILWEGKKLTPAAEKLLGRAEKKYFAEKEKIWAFLGTLTPPKTPKNAVWVQLYEETVRQSGTLYVLTMILWQLQQLLEVEAGVFAGAPFRRASLEGQVRKFESGEIKALYNRLIDLDYRAKSGQLKLALDQELLEILLGVI